MKHTIYEDDAERITATQTGDCWLIKITDKTENYSYCTVSLPMSAVNNLFYLGIKKTDPPKRGAACSFSDN